MRRSLLVLAGGVTLAGVAVMTGLGGSGTAAEITGDPLDRAHEQAAFEALADKPPPPPPPKPPAVLDLGKLELVGDHYEAPRGDARVSLTLDPDLQAAADKLLDEAKVPRGAIVMMAPDGRILALAGRRQPDPKASATSDPLLAVDAWAPAASVFKLVTASALVAHGVDPDDKVCFHGGIRSVLESNLRDDKRDNNCQSLVFGVAHSNNAIVGKLAFQHLQPQQLTDEAVALGLDRKLDLGLPATAGTLAIPSTHDLAFAQAAAGFTDFEASTYGTHLSPLGGAMLAATFADGGNQPLPYVIAGTPATSTRVLPTDIAAKVGRMMEGTCEFGSASKSFGRHRKVRVAGKTGTLTHEATPYEQYSWFVGYAPADKPEVIVAVVLGNPESWQLKGHEVGQRLIDRAMQHGRKRLQW